MSENTNYHQQDRKTIHQPQTHIHQYNQLGERDIETKVKVFMHDVHTVGVHWICNCAKAGTNHGSTFKCGGNG